MHLCPHAAEDEDGPALGCPHGKCPPGYEWRCSLGLGVVHSPCCIPAWLWDTGQPHPGSRDVLLSHEFGEQKQSCHQKGECFCSPWGYSQAPWPFGDVQAYLPAPLLSQRA